MALSACPATGPALTAVTSGAPADRGSRLSSIQLLNRIQSSGLVSNEKPATRLADEPAFPSYICYAQAPQTASASVLTASGFGTHTDPDTARLIAHAEALEHLCLVATDTDVWTAPFTERVRPSTFYCYSNAQTADRAAHLAALDAASYRWWPARELTTGARYRVPAQLVSNAARYAAEPQIRKERISTGAAFGEAGGDRAAASGLLEAIERDAVIGAFLRRRRLLLIDRLPARIGRLVAELERAGLEVFLFDAASDLGVAVVLAVTVDRSGRGPALSTGAAARFDYCDAAEKALLESVQGRVARRLWIAAERPKVPASGAAIKSDLDRILYWSLPSRIGLLDFWLDNPDRVAFDRLRCAATDLQSLLAVFAARGYRVYYADLTHPALAAAGFSVAKVLVPALHPTYMNEAAISLFSPHLGELNVPDPLPHPLI